MPTIMLWSGIPSDSTSHHVPSLVTVTDLECVESGEVRLVELLTSGAKEGLNRSSVRAGG